MSETKCCKTCGEEKPLTDFYIDKRYGTQKQPCKPCYLEYGVKHSQENRERYQENARKWRAENAESVLETNRRWQQANPEKMKAKDRRHYRKLKQDGRAQEIWRAKNLKRLYNLTPERFAEILEAQQGVCACCGEPPNEGENLHVDHDHECCPGQKSCGNCIRGLVHNGCNRGIGLLKDDPEALMGAAQYLVCTRDLLRPMLAALSNGK